jgi:hypothetical protein
MTLSKEAEALREKTRDDIAGTAVLRREDEYGYYLANPEGCADAALSALNLTWEQAANLAAGRSVIVPKPIGAELLSKIFAEQEALAAAPKPGDTT